MPCSARDRDSLREAAAECRALESVRATDVLDPSESPGNTWTLELVCEADGMPPAVDEHLAGYDLRTLHVSPQGVHTHVVAAV